MRKNSFFAACLSKRIVFLFVLVALITSHRASTFQVRLFAAPEVYDNDPQILNRNLGLTQPGIVFEGFENKRLIDGLETNVQGGEDSEDNRRTAWTGKLGSSTADDAVFEISLPNIGLFGIGLSDNDGGEELLSINDDPPFPLKDLPNHITNGRTQAYYVLIEAELGDPPITKVAFTKGFSISFDHLALRQRAEGFVAKPPKFLVNLIDGSQIVAPLLTTEIKLRSLDKDMTIPVDRLAGMERKSKKGPFSILLKNDDKIDAELKADELKFSTALGELSIPFTKIQSVARSYGNIIPAKPGPSAKKIRDMNRRAETNGDNQLVAIANMMNFGNRPELKAEFVKLSEALKARGISASAAGSLGLTIFVPSNRAKEADEILLRLIDSGEIQHISSKSRQLLRRGGIR